MGIAAGVVNGIPDIPAKRDTKEKGKHRKKRWEWVRNNG